MTAVPGSESPAGAVPGRGWLRIVIASVTGAVTVHDRVRGVTAAPLKHCTMSAGCVIASRASSVRAGSRAAIIRSSASVVASFHRALRSVAVQRAHRVEADRPQRGRQRGDRRRADQRQRNPANVTGSSGPTP